VTSTGQPWSEPTLWPEDTHASHSQSLDHAEEKMILDTFGPCSPSAFAWYDPDTHSWRTFQATLDSDSEAFNEIWPRSGMTRDGIAYQLPPSAPRTYAIAYSSSLHGELQWTPTAKANQDSSSMEARVPGSHLWPTPQASDCQRTTVADCNWASNITGALERAGERGKLNPAWVEWLMGFPEGWTDLEHSETP